MFGAAPCKSEGPCRGWKWSKGFTPLLTPVTPRGRNSGVSPACSPPVRYSPNGMITSSVSPSGKPREPSLGVIGWDSNPRLPFLETRHMPLCHLPIKHILIHRYLVLHCKYLHTAIFEKQKIIQEQMMYLKMLKRSFFLHKVCSRFSTLTKKMSKIFWVQVCALHTKAFAVVLELCAKW